MTISEQIIQVIEALCTKLGIAVDWTSENVIPYIEVLCGKLVTYEIGTSIAWIAIWLAFSVGSIVATKKFYPVFKEGVENSSPYEIGWEFASGFAIAALIIINLISVIVVCNEVMDIIKCLTFPEMYVFEYVQKIVNGC